jgi:ribose 5-phosphate isomerase A
MEMMTGEFSSDEILDFKRLAAERALDFIKPGMVVGLGSGSTAEIAIEKLGKRIADRRLTGIIGIPTSRETEQIALRNGVLLSALNEHPRVDLTIDGADEVDPDLNLIKGAGGALFREKIVAGASSEVIIVIDETKLSDRLGRTRSVPVEVHPLAIKSVSDFVRRLGAEVVLRRDEKGNPYKTEQGNDIIDCRFGPIENPDELAGTLSLKPGVIEHGLFLNMATLVIVGGKAGIRQLQR